MLKRPLCNPTRLLACSLLLGGLIAGRAASASSPTTPTMTPSDEPVICPYCGGAFSFEALGIEFSRELGLRAVIACISA